MVAVRFRWSICAYYQDPRVFIIIFELLDLEKILTNFKNFIGPCYFPNKYEIKFYIFIQFNLFCWLILYFCKILSYQLIIFTILSY